MAPLYLYKSKRTQHTHNRDSQTQNTQTQHTLAQNGSLQATLESVPRARRLSYRSPDRGADQLKDQINEH